VIASPHNDRDCLDALTQHAAALVRDRDPAIVTIAAQHADTESLADWIRMLPQHDDDGAACDGPRLESCDPPQRLRTAPSTPNCFERTDIYLAAAELIDPEPVRRAATLETPNGLHTFPTEDGEPVILDPRQSRNGLRAGLFRGRNGGGAGTVVLSPSEAVNWIADLAEEPAERFAEGAARVRNGHAAMSGVLVGRPICVADLRDVAFVLALADREARAYGPAGTRIVQSTAQAIDRLDRVAADHWQEATAPRNVPELRFGGYTFTPDVPLLASLARVGGRLGGQVGLEALKLKLASIGITSPVLGSLERELNREGLTLGQLARPPAMIGSLGALTPESIAGRWLAGKV
jgi:hypothetical protein